MSDTKRLRVGFVDYNLNNYHANTYLKLLRGPLAERAVVAGCWGEQDAASREWAVQNNVAWFDTPAQLAVEVDGLMLLAPDNVDRHLPHLQALYPAAAGKPIYVDKTLAGTLANARTLVEVASAQKSAVFSSSAVPFAPEMLSWFAQGGAGAYDAEGRGPGQWSNYGVHTVAPVLRALGHDIARLRVGGREGLVRVQLEWHDGRTGVLSVNRAPGEGFALWLTSEGGITRLNLNDATFYQNLAAAALDFFASGKGPIPAAESLMTVAVLETVAAHPGPSEWIELPKF